MSRVEQSAGGATESSPERSAAELRDIMFSASNPCQGVTEFARLSSASRLNIDSASLPALIRRARRAGRAYLRQVSC